MIRISAVPSDPWVSYLVRVPPGEVDWGAKQQPVFWYPTPVDDVYLFSQRLAVARSGVSVAVAAQSLPVGATVIGGWDQSGIAQDTVDLADYAAIRPLGNNADGSATGPLDFAGLAGYAPRQLGTGGAIYPDDDSPFDLDVRHKEFTGEFSGHGWRAELVGGSGSRDPGVRAVGLYSDQECIAYLYTTGAFVEGASDWQTDDAGDPLTIWYTESPLGQLTGSREAIHMAVLWASVQEGHQTLTVDADSIRYLFWNHKQGEVVAAAAAALHGWEGTGAMVLGVSCGGYRISDVEQFVELMPDTRIRFGRKGNEAVFVELIGDVLLTEEYTPAAVGARIWVYH